MTNSNENLPLVSVYITTQNRLPLLKRAVDSVLQQTYPKIELFVSDDGSTDGTHEYLLQMQQQGKLKAILNKQSHGACHARNRAIEQAKGEFISGLDDDDFFKPQRIANFVAYWQQLDTDKKQTAAGLFDSWQDVCTGQKFKTDIDHACYTDFKYANAVGNQVFAPKAHFLGAGMFDEHMPAWQDWDMWLRMSRRYGTFYNIHTLSYCMDSTSASNRISQKKQDNLRLAYQRLQTKMDVLSWVQKAHLLAALYNYPQVRVHIAEVIQLMSIGKFRLVLRVLKRLLLGASPYKNSHNCFIGETQHFILTSGRSGSNYLSNTLNLSPDCTNYGEVLGDWTVPYRLFGHLICRWWGAEAYLRFIYRSRVFFRLAQIYSAFSHLRTGRKVNFKRLHQIRSLGIKDFMLTIEQRQAENFLLKHPEIKIIYLYRKNLLKKFISQESLQRRKIAKSYKSVKMEALYIDPATLLENLRQFKKEADKERTYLKQLKNHQILELAYEDYFASSESILVWNQRIFEFLGITPHIEKSKQKKIMPNTLKDAVSNSDEIVALLKGGEFEQFLY